MPQQLFSRPVKEKKKTSQPNLHNSPSSQLQQFSIENSQCFSHRIARVLTCSTCLFETIFPGGRRGPEMFFLKARVESSEGSCPIEKKLYGGVAAVVGVVGWRMDWWENWKIGQPKILRAPRGSRDAFSRQRCREDRIFVNSSPVVEKFNIHRIPDWRKYRFFLPSNQALKTPPSPAEHSSRRYFLFTKIFRHLVQYSCDGLTQLGQHLPFRDVFSPALFFLEYFKTHRLNNISHRGDQVSLPCSSQLCRTVSSLN